ncbi:staygreen family protein [Anoxybacteroides tepidamans]|uniref:staygreen family protein n=1 Tax=Anoxybacteroides tepidamans TaxID=265948 RepID=UPI0004847DBA|nr:staygreen family protein [Anoxybacillus tepidamans]
MNQLKPEKLHIQWGDETSLYTPAIGRKYTLTHSDATGDLYLHIGRAFAVERLSKMRDEVLAEWKTVKQTLILFVYVYVGNANISQEASQQRKKMFEKELPLALEAIRYGDRQFFQTYPSLDFSPILVHFTSEYPHLNITESYGSPYMYK